MEITNKAKYLGIFLGPPAGTCQWSKAIEKFQTRISTISSLHLPPALARVQFASRVLPFLAYFAQVIPPPPNSKRVGMNAVLKSFRFCGNSLSYITSFSLRLVRETRFPDLLAYLASCGLRAAHKTPGGHVDQHHELLSVACEELPFAVHRCKKCTPLGWDTPALCTNQFFSLLTMHAVT